MSTTRTENPTDSKVWTVLRHRDGGLEVWDCLPFGPWALAVGPFGSHAEALDAYKTADAFARCARDRR